MPLLMSTSVNVVGSKDPLTSSRDAHQAQVPTTTDSRKFFINFTHSISFKFSLIDLRINLCYNYIRFGFHTETSFLFVLICAEGKSKAFMEEIRREGSDTFRFGTLRTGSSGSLLASGTSETGISCIRVVLDDDAMVSLRLILALRIFRADFTPDETFVHLGKIARILEVDFMMNHSLFGYMLGFFQANVVGMSVIGEDLRSSSSARDFTQQVSSLLTDGLPVSVRADTSASHQKYGRCRAASSIMDVTPTLRTFRVGVIQEFAATASNEEVVFSYSLHWQPNAMKYSYKEWG